MMNDWVRFVGPHQALELFGVKLVGVNAESGRKLLFSIAFLVVLWALNRILQHIVVMVRGRDERLGFWARQGIRVAVTITALIGLISVWFDEPGRLATMMGLVTAGLAFALQRVITALAGYVVILRGNTFNVGDRITMGGVRGDVISLGFIQTTIMEMGEPPRVQDTEPAIWVRSRQYTGRIVTVTNDKIFDTPIYNYTREFPYIWEELMLPVPYDADRNRAEQILLHAAGAHTVNVQEVAEEDIAEIERRYAVHRSDVAPRVYYRMTSNWLEMSVRFICRAHDVRELKNRMARDILAALDDSGIPVAATTIEIVKLPPLAMRMEGARGSSGPSDRRDEQRH